MHTIDNTTGSVLAGGQPLMTLEAAAARLGISLATVRRLAVRRGVITRVGGRVFVSAEALVRLVDGAAVQRGGAEGTR